MSEDQYILREKLLRVLAEAKRNNPSYSLRALAKKMNLSAGYLSLFLQGKKILSPQYMEKIVCCIVEDPRERLALLRRLNFNVIEKVHKDGSVSHLLQFPIFIREINFE